MKRRVFAAGNVPREVVQAAHRWCGGNSLGDIERRRQFMQGAMRCDRDEDVPEGASLPYQLGWQWRNRWRSDRDFAARHPYTGADGAA